MFIQVNRLKHLDREATDDTDYHLVNFDLVRSINRNEEYETVLTFSDGTKMRVDEGMDDIEAALNKAGEFVTVVPPN